MPPIIYPMIAPVIGVLLYPLLHDHPKITRVFDRCMYVMVPLLVLTHVLGHHIEHRGWEVGVISILLGVMLVGLLVPIGIEHTFHSIAPTTEALSIIAGFIGLGFHAMIEGASLNADTPTAMIPITVHRLAVGLMIWWILHPRYGTFIAIIGVSGLLSATFVGFVLADTLPNGFTGSDFFQAFVGGSLLHVIFHERYHGSPHDHGH